ncbi:MAG: ABC transporter ATP-binding protein, partial [Candidatus Saccharimonadales bacterium]
LSADWHNAHATGEKESLVAKNIIKFEAMIDELVFDTVPAALRISFTTIFMFTIGWPYGVISLLTMIAYYLVVRWSERILAPLRKDFRERLKAIEKFGAEITKNWRTIKEIGREEDFSATNDDMLMSFWRDEVPRHRIATNQFIRQDDVVTISRGMLYAMISLSVLWTQPALGSVVLATTWMERSYSNFGRFADFQMRLNEGLESLRELVNLMCLPPTIQQPDNPVWPERLQGRVEFRDVGFRYPEASECALSGVNFVAEPFTATALVGSSGCGKSTLMGLLQRLHDPTNGEVLVDGIDLRQLDYDRYRRQGISVVSQDIELFDTTIMENIRVSYPEASDDEVIEAACLACADEFIVKQEHGYQTEVGENGIRLSGGQKQRIAIARALLRKPVIMILDEATSALDAVSQQKVQESINQLIERREVTIFIIAHRFSTIESADQVVVLNDGALAEIGTHAELKRRNGLYTRLRAMEAKGLLD